MPENERFKELLKQQRGILFNTEKEFGEKIGEDKHGISALKLGRKQLRVEHIQAIKENYPGVNIDWLLSGEGPMLLQNGSKKSNFYKSEGVKDYQTVHEENPEHSRYGRDVSKGESISLIDNKFQGSFESKSIPFYDFEASAGPNIMFNDIREFTDTFLIIPGLHDCDISLSVWGDSMYPYYNSGDVIICKEIFDKEVISFGDTYLIITSELRLVKYIHPHPTNEEKIILKSANNANGQHPDIPLHLDKILRLYLVKGKLQRKNI